ncbi:MAG TPA: pyrroline-5-carboxylate reductase [Polyangia bacterium]|nr:pyrroline-5-carboxylate reductase [Polyangia bacterium]
MIGKTETLAVLGTGTMGEAILRGLLRSGKLEPGQIVGTDRRSEVTRAIHEKHGIRTTSDNHEAVTAAQVALLCVKPQEVEPLVTDPAVAGALAGKLVISIAAGIRLDQLAAWLPQSAVVRAMPNTPCLIGEGMTVIARGPRVTDAQAATALEIFRCVGGCLEAEDKVMDAVTSLNGSGPAFAYIILEALADGGVRMGLRRETAMQIAAQMVQGAARMVLQTGMHPAALKDQVTTPAGSTIAGLLILEDGRIRSVIARAVEEAARTAATLGQKPAAKPGSPSPDK